MSRIRFNRLELKIPPPVVVFVGGLLNWSATRWTDSLFSPPWLVIGVLVVVAGVVGVTGVLVCLRCKTTVHPWSPDETSVLVTDGIFQLSRNPMYLALLVFLVACCLYQPTWLSPFIFGGVTRYLTRFQILPEERILSDKFGDQYAQYASSVRRWL
jgi:protein-S-isoprenylcysteine O-methyltransferase Ste14